MEVEGLSRNVTELVLGGGLFFLRKTKSQCISVTVTSYIHHDSHLDVASSISFHRLQ